MLFLFGAFSNVVFFLIQYYAFVELVSPRKMYINFANKLHYILFCQTIASVVLGQIQRIFSFDRTHDLFFFSFDNAYTFHPQYFSSLHFIYFAQSSQCSILSENVQRYFFRTLSLAPSVVVLLLPKHTIKCSLCLPFCVCVAATKWMCFVVCPISHTLSTITTHIYG